MLFQVKIHGEDRTPFGFVSGTREQCLVQAVASVLKSYPIRQVFISDLSTGANLINVGSCLEGEEYPRDDSMLWYTVKPTEG